MAKANTRLAGHGLRNEGRLWTGLTYRADIAGPGKCECGEKSDPLPNAAQRKKWHRNHKNDIRSELGLAMLDAEGES